jgi:hypothetical protein
MNNTTLPERLSERQLAEQLEKHPKTVALWRVRGIGPAVTWIGRSPFYTLDAVTAWLTAGGTRATQSRCRNTRTHAAK